LDNPTRRLLAHDVNYAGLLCNSAAISSLRRGLFAQ
jgi:hypothetical protein